MKVYGFFIQMFGAVTVIIGIFLSAVIYHFATGALVDGSLSMLIGFAIIFFNPLILIGILLIAWGRKLHNSDPRRSPQREHRINPQIGKVSSSD